MTSSLQDAAERHFQDTLGTGFEALLAPINDAAPCGSPARYSTCHAALQEARRQDDLSLPLGTWQRDLKRADWAEASRLIVHALQHESKDMQLLAWLLEAQIRRHGIAGVAATLVLTRALCLQHWEQLHPQVQDGDVEHRANIINSIAEKNLPALRLAPLIGIGQGHSYSWADWEQAQLNEQIKVANGKVNSEVEGVSLTELQSATTAAPTEGFLALHTQLQAGLQAIAELSVALDPLFGEHAPGMGGMVQLLQQMNALVEGELHRRGVRLREDAPQLPDPTLAASVQPPTDETASAGLNDGAIHDRADAYARLAEAAEFLMRLDPHSPVPYLVRRATEWGRLNTVELYQELFLRLNGQLNIFEMLGLETGAASRGQ
ncbi:type VI secretion-associated protein, ImpA family [Herbaspirillum sp. CF444]|uniref:type VI secretion system protein TssA n=1 Tax=Herbaspirillum sp. CF444 TaxID=1144319 RepID=UPI000272686D|nr:type VI secretion system protein TssA [Herbaspirillum sp. CF444]EJL94077.1 type VI secretion-associated protein, ImpA family [Herbaspirillum sp. CF444]